MPGSQSMGWQKPYSLTRKQFTGQWIVSETNTVAERHTHTLEWFIREDLAVNHVTVEFMSFEDRLRSSIKKQLSMFPDNFYRPV